MSISPEFGMLGGSLTACAAIPPEDGARWAIQLIQQLGGTFLYADKPDPTPEQRINSKGNIMSIPMLHQLLSLYARHGVGFGFLKDTTSILIAGDISFIDMAKVEEAASSFLEFVLALYPHGQVPSAL